MEFDGAKWITQRWGWLCIERTPLPGNKSEEGGGERDRDFATERREVWDLILDDPWLCSKWVWGAQGGPQEV